MQLNNLAEVRDFDIEECINHLEMLHKDSKGYITISSKDPNYKQWHYKSEDIIDNIDIDCHKTKYSKEAVKYFL